MKKIKTVLLRIKNKLRLAWQWIAGECIMIWHWIKNLFFVYLTTKSQLRIFEGYGHWWFAKKYADRRTKISRINKKCGGKTHYALPWGDYSLIVLNRLELRNLKNKRYCSKNINIVKILENAYYISK